MLFFFGRITYLFLTSGMLFSLDWIPDRHLYFVIYPPFLALKADSEFYPNNPLSIWIHWCDNHSTQKEVGRSYRHQLAALDKITLSHKNQWHLETCRNCSVTVSLRGMVCCSTSWLYAKPAARELTFLLHSRDVNTDLDLKARLEKYKVSRTSVLIYS